MSAGEPAKGGNAGVDAHPASRSVLVAGNYAETACVTKSLGFMAASANCELERKRSK